ncbi:hypothetical protein DPMN_047818 [Dreissena polymorpha]|uniref:Uncharacterized protein n=1 Tax=Dreissena polymorpha TaxID=45954 RepID=A0A9D4HZI2_DREPO|nr:hypothetical protein DPMN_047818 [Dreissena polymorpha]
MRNGRDSVKSDRSYDRKQEENSVLKVKEERRESLTREEEHNSILGERERMRKNELPGQTS